MDRKNETATNNPVMIRITCCINKASHCSKDKNRNFFWFPHSYMLESDEQLVSWWDITLPIQTLQINNRRKHRAKNTWDNCPLRASPQLMSLFITVNSHSFCQARQMRFVVRLWQNQTAAVKLTKLFSLWIELNKCCNNTQRRPKSLHAALFFWTCANTPERV